jgi:hypothetical protein
VRLLLNVSAQCGGEAIVVAALPDQGVPVKDGRRKPQWITVPYHWSLSAFESGFETGVPMPSAGIALVMPGTCVYCNMPASTTKRVKLSDTVSAGRRTTITRKLQLDIPYCDGCMKKSKLAGRIGALCALGYGLTSLVIFLTQHESGVGGGFVFLAFIMSMLGAFIGWLFWWGVLIKPLLGIFCRVIKDTPFWLNSGALGIRAQVGADALRVKFANSEFADEFLALHPHAQFEG